ncbi:MAG: M48 family metallopeptidase, partial [bacterium]|nr:M48 family metallopeptidase [bacterium]
MARRPQAPLSVRQRRADEDRAVMRRLRGQGTVLATNFGLRYKCIDPEIDGVTEYYGICYEDGEIRIRLRHAVTGRVLKESSLVDTLCHELAHLRHLNHGLK